MAVGIVHPEQDPAHGCAVHAVVVDAPLREVGCERFDGVVAGHADGEVVEARGGARSVGIAAQREVGTAVGVGHRHAHPDALFDELGHHPVAEVLLIPRQ